jgi:hypothetical protein
MRNEKKVFISRFQPFPLAEFEWHFQKIVSSDLWFRLDWFVLNHCVSDSHFCAKKIIFFHSNPFSRAKVND